MDNLIPAFTPWLLGLLFFVALGAVAWLCRWLLEPSPDRRMAENRKERRLRRLRLDCPECHQRAAESITHPMYYGLTWPETRRVR